MDRFIESRISDYLNDEPGSVISRKDIQALVDEVLEWRKLAMSMTPGGSEYTDIKYCRTFLENKNREYYEFKKYYYAFLHLSKRMPE